MQIIFVLVAMVLGILYNYNFTGFTFNCNLCLFAGLTIVLPSLLNLRFGDLSLVITKKNIIIKNIFANYIILPIIAIVIGLLTNDFGIAGGIFLLSVLAGGGMVMHWIKESNSDEKVGIVLFCINIFFLLLSFYLFRHFSMIFADIFSTNGTTATLVNHLPLRDVLKNLIIIPLITSIVLRIFLPIIPKLMQKNRKMISNISIFLIVFYLFALENNNIIMTIDTLVFMKALIATIAFYISCFIIAKALYNTSNTEERAAFWHLFTRYITIALAISAYSSSLTFGTTIILPIMIAYFIQIPFSIYYSKVLLKDTKEAAVNS